MATGMHEGRIVDVCATARGKHREKSKRAEVRGDAAKTRARRSDDALASCVRAQLAVPVRRKDMSIDGRRGLAGRGKFIFGIAGGKAGKRRQ